MFDGLNEFALNILRGINSVVGNYGWSVVVFTIMIRLILTPFDVKSRIGMRRMSKLQPKMAELQKKYAKDQDKLNQKMSELYRKEKASPLSGCLPLLLSYPILIWMFTAMRTFANEQVARQVVEMLQNPNVLPTLDGWLWVKNLWMADSPFASALVDLNTMRQVPLEIWAKAFTPEVLQSLQALHPSLLELTAESFTKDNLAATLEILFGTLNSMSVYSEAAGALPGWTIPLFITNLSIMKEFNGLFILPALSAASQFFMSKLTPQQPQPQPQPNANGQDPQAMGNFMKWFFPIFSLWICASSNAAFALYWVTSNLIMMVTTTVINRVLDNKEKKEQLTAEGIVQ